jgi:hypothetical protein
MQNGNPLGKGRVQSVVTGYLASRQTADLSGDRNELNAKLDAIVRNFDLAWLTAGGTNPLQLLWNSRDALATNELLNFGDAVANFESVDANWLRGRVSVVKTGDEGNRAGAIFELLGLNFYLSAGHKVLPSGNSNPGYDGSIELPDNSSLLVSIKNHGITSHEKFFRRNSKELDDQFTRWLKQHTWSGVELRVQCRDHLNATEWATLKQDVKDILNGQLDGTASSHQVRGAWQISLNNIGAQFQPLSTTRVSSVVFIAARAHRNEQDKFVEDLRRGCSNLVKHTKTQPDTACPVLFVRLCANASFANCAAWARDYFANSPNERVGLILLYQAVVVTSDTSTSLAHYLLPILGPQFEVWAHPPDKPARQLPNLAVLIGVQLQEAAQKVLKVDGQHTPLDDLYVYQRGDIYRFYRFDGSGLEVHLSNPAPRIKIHAEIGDDSGSAVVEMVAPETGELKLLP